MRNTPFFSKEYGALNSRKRPVILRHCARKFSDYVAVKGLNSDQSKQNFKHDFEAKKIYERLNTTPDANPNENYCILETAILESMSNRLKEKVVKFNRKRHKRDPCMSYGILKS